MVKYISSALIITLLIGVGTSTYNGEGIAASAVQFNYVAGLAVDTQNGDVYVADRNTPRVRVLTRSTGLVYTFAGTGSGSNNGDGGDATSAGITPDPVYLDSSLGYLYVGDYNNNKVRYVYSVMPTMSPTTLLPTVCPTTAAPSAVPTSTRSTMNGIATIMGTGGSSSSGTGGPSESASVKSPHGVWMDSVGVLYVSELDGNCIRKFALSDHIVVNVVGTCGASGTLTSDGGVASSAGIDRPISLMGDSIGNLYFAEFGNNMVRYVSSAGTMNTLAGTGTPSNSGDGGPATSATLSAPVGVWVSSSGYVYMSLYDGSFVRRVSGGVIALVAGKCLFMTYVAVVVMYIFAVTGSGTAVNLGGQATSASLSLPERVCGDTQGLLYISDSGEQ